MNLTVALLAGLFLLLPGLTALATWNRLSTRHGARRPELPLTSVSALFIAFAVSIAAHLLGGLLVELIVLASHELGQLALGHWPAAKTLPIPMRAMMEMVAGPPPLPPPLAPTTAEAAKAAVEAARAAAEAHTDWTVAGVWMMILQVLGECVLVFFFVSSRGAELLVDRLDPHGQGWVYKNVVRPHRHGQTPVAWVLTTLGNGKELGVGYRGVVAEIRQGGDGELKAISLAAPDAFVYELKDPKVFDAARLKMHDRRSLEGVIVLEAASVRNILINDWKPTEVDAFEADVANLKPPLPSSPSEATAAPAAETGLAESNAASPAAAPGGEDLAAAPPTLVKPKASRSRASKDKPGV